MTTTKTSPETSKVSEVLAALDSHVYGLRFRSVGRMVARSRVAQQAPVCPMRQGQKSPDREPPMSATYGQASLKAQTLPGYTPNEGRADGTRDLWPAPARLRRRCTCGCKGRETHVGGNNAIGLMGGCELSVRRWVRDGYMEATK